MKPILTYGIPVLAVVTLLVFALKSEAPEPSVPEPALEISEPESSTRELAMACVTHGSAISYHVHPELAILVDGERVELPADIGVDASCMRALHTHDATGKIHIEYPTEQPFTLGDFFAVWGKPFSATQILDKVADDSHAVTMTVNGKPSTKFENLVMRDHDVIVIEYGEK
ncbi:hypothetical protein EPO34_01410 [Patescibacteria group bacterium]|nr:MAG: hypothetical protein EPO34_01410 [Patescibacteria group bacterium]